MRRKRSGWMKLGLLSILLVGLFFGVVPLSMAEKGDVLDRNAIGEIRIFELSDLTGPTSSTGITIHEAISDKIADINEKGGIIYEDPNTKRLERVTIKFNFGDDRAKSGLVPMLYERLSTEKPTPVLGICVSSSSCEVIPKWMERDKIPCVAMSSGMPIWFPPRWSFVTGTDYPALAAASAKWAMDDWKKKGKSGKPKWAWLTLDVPYGMAPITPEVENYIKHLGFEIAGTWTIPLNPVDYSSELMFLEKAGVDYFYGNTVNQEMKVMKDLTRLGLKDKMQRIVGPWGINQKLIENAGAAADGLAGVHFVSLPEETNRPGVKEAGEMSKRHNRAIFDSDYIMGYGSAMVGLQAIEKALRKKGYPITGSDVYEEFFDPKGFDLGGTVNIRPYVPNERRGGWMAYIRGIKDGKMIRLSEDFDIPDMRPGGPWTPKK